MKHLLSFCIVLSWSLVSTLLGAGPTTLPSEPLPALPEKVTATVDIYPQTVVRAVSPQFIGTNLTQYATDKKQIAIPETLERVRSLGVKTMRFPNGCFADLYNWKKPADSEVTVEEFIAFCDAIGAEPYYTLNMQGGTEGREGPPPAGAPLDEVIRYRHTAPNPCGQTNYHFGTLAEALDLLQKHTIERAIAGQTPILHYELGNENWGQSKTDWTPPVYGKNAEVWCRALRKAFDEARKKHKELAGRGLHIVAVGFPTMGNNQDPLKAVDHGVNAAWAAEINRLADLKLIDAVTEHFYPFPPNNGDALIWTVHNLHNILALRTGQPSARLDGYTEPALAYRVPIEVTEWNVKCWGRNRIREDLPLKNGNFEKGLESWTESTAPAAGGKATPMKGAARRGVSGVRLATTAQGQSVEIRQTFSVADRPKSAAFGAYLWAKTKTPLQLHLILLQANDGPNKGKPIDHRVATQVDMWERMQIGRPPFEDTTEVELIVRLEGPNASASIDEAVPLQWTTFADSMPPAAQRFEQQLFAVDAFREMLHWPIPRTHWHHLFGNYPCPQLQADGKERDNAAAFQLLNERIGEQVVRTECAVPTYAYNTYADMFATDFGAMVPDTRDIPALSAVSTRAGSDLYVLLVNRTTDRSIRTTIRLHDAAMGGPGDCRTLVGELDVAGADVKQTSLAVGTPLQQVVPPFSAQVLRIPLQ